MKPTASHPDIASDAAPATIAAAIIATLVRRRAGESMEGGMGVMGMGDDSDGDGGRPP
jgi:hypothetical protein